MSARLAHTSLRVTAPEAAVRSYTTLGFEPCGRVELGAASNLHLGLPSDCDVLDLTVSRDPHALYETGTSFGRLALLVDDLDAAVVRLQRQIGVTPERPAYRPGGRADHLLITFVADPDGHRIELTAAHGYRACQDVATPVGQIAGV